MKTKLHSSFLVLALLALAILNPQLSTAFAQGTAFTYQGRLSDGIAPANGTYDFRFRLASDPLANNYVGAAYLTNGIAVSNGLFITTMDFGPGIFTGSNYWLEVDVRTNGAGNYTALNPLQALTPTPYAIFATSASNLLGTLPTAQLNGTVGNGQLANNFITVTAGTGLSGGGAVALGGTTTLNNAGVISLASGGGVTVSAANGAVTLGSTATSANTANAIVSRDGSGNFSAGSLTLAGTLNLPATPFTIYSGGNLLMDADNNFNFFIGLGAGNSTTSGSDNTANGYESLGNNMFGSGNTANGKRAMLFNVFGSDNTADGDNALDNLNFLGGESGNNNIALGYNAGSAFDSIESFNIDIGNVGVAGENNTIRIGTPGTQSDAYIAGTLHGAAGNNQNQFLVSAPGGVEIGTGSPEQALSVMGGMNVDAGNANNGPVGSGGFNQGGPTNGCLTFGTSSSGTGYSGEGIQSKRTSGGTQYDLEFFTGFNKQMVILNNGNVGIGSTNPANLLVVDSSGSPAYCNGTTWVNGSDRNSKQDFAAINPGEVLQKVAALPITEWQYKVAPGQEHVGPMAQDFHAAFGLNGADDKHIATVDEGGVALAAIQGLNEKLEVRSEKAEGGIQKSEARIQTVETENAKLQAQVTDLRSQLESLQKTVARLTAKASGSLALNTQPQEAK